MKIKTEMIQWSGNKRWSCKGHVPKMEQWWFPLLL